MKLITFLLPSGEEKAGWISQNEFAVDMHEVSSKGLPESIIDLVAKWSYFKPMFSQYENISPDLPGVYNLDQVQLLAPIPKPVSIRDFYAFEDHVKTARANRGLEIVEEWYKFPVFYFTNHLAVKGPNDFIPIPKGCKALDYELEIACVIGKEGRNISVQNAEQHILGFCIMNDWSARDFQKEEMKVGLGPAKGKDFATSFGPFIATVDELTEFKKDQHYRLNMAAYVNGKHLSNGNTEDLYYTFSEMIERASAGVTLYPGEVIGSGTVGTGCILELGTEVQDWLKKGDEVALSIDGLGTLVNIIGEEGG
ncbi:fumarylacetoacetate hydrolase family protein [Jeotgalibacillus sp. S-D1]|uniref:fumarylacetoacetate hydrolase family protein n=1 Tax=Jeotgalibacillus sp. S-D1 TaxID=2552189 RepID=UPI001059252D|nr:fumarylacetoacetate hydrolase family protein [Jeotgalibacillus sp. S-D1]TDL35258.1 fumarylacetoacetate hydrolase family protein [Jeotgalibacillus sp. S-D1]